jgi:NTE family protein
MNGGKVPAVRVGLVLAAGGSVGVAYHGAVLSTIEESTGWDPRTAEVIIGTSAGSITGALLRAGISAADLARISEGLDLSAEGEQIATLGRPHRPRPQLSHALRFRPIADPLAVVHGLTHPRSHPLAALVAALLPAGGIPTEALSAGITEVFAGRWPPAPLWLCSTDLRTGARVVFGRDGSPAAPVGLAVAASCAIPGYFEPVTIGGRRYVDGGVSSMGNLDLVSGLGLDLVVVSSPISQASARPTIAADSVLRQPVRIQLHRELRALRRSGVKAFAVEPNRSVAAAMGLNPMDARQRGPVSRATRLAVRGWLEGSARGQRLASELAAAAGTGPEMPRSQDGVLRASG